MCSQKSAPSPLVAGEPFPTYRTEYPLWLFPSIWQALSPRDRLHNILTVTRQRRQARFIEAELGFDLVMHDDDEEDNPLQMELFEEV